MARAVTAKYEELILEVEFVSGTWSRICGLKDVTINRSSQIDTTEVPDCDDESLPLAIERAVRSQEVTVSASGVWAMSSHKRMQDWWYSGQPLPTRIRNAKVAADGPVGDPIIESGPAILVSMSESRTKGQKNTRDIEIQFDGVPARTNKLAP